MAFGRAVLKYFKESELQPSALTKKDLPRSANLLTEPELGDIRDFSVEFGKVNIVFLNKVKLTRKPHLRAFVMFLFALGAVSVDETDQGVRVKGAGCLSQHLPRPSRSMAGLCLANANGCGSSSGF